MIRHSSYFDSDKLKNLNPNVKDTFIVLSLNIQSVRAKIDSLRIFIATLDEYDFCVSAFCIQETWLEDSLCKDDRFFYRFFKLTTMNVYPRVTILAVMEV